MVSHDEWLKSLVIAEEKSLDAVADKYFASRARLADIALPRGTLLIIESPHKRSIQLSPVPNEELQRLGMQGIYASGKNELKDLTIYQGIPFKILK